MPHSISAAKRVRQNLKRRDKNRKGKSELKTLTKDLLALIDGKKKEEAQTAFKKISSIYDRAAKKKLIHKNNANRHKARLAQRLARAIA